MASELIPVSTCACVAGQDTNLASCILRRTWIEVRASGVRPKARYGHGLALLGPAAAQHPDAPAAAEPRALLFGGETAAGAVSDLFVLRGLPPAAASGGGGVAAQNAAQLAWTPLEAAGNAPVARKGHAIAGEPGQIHECSWLKRLRQEHQASMKMGWEHNAEGAAAEAGNLNATSDLRWPPRILSCTMLATRLEACTYCWHHSIKCFTGHQFAVSRAV